METSIQLQVLSASHWIYLIPFYSNLDCYTFHLHKINFSFVFQSNTRSPKLSFPTSIPGTMLHIFQIFKCVLPTRFSSYTCKFKIKCLFCVPPIGKCTRLQQTVLTFLYESQKQLEYFPVSGLLN